MNDAISSEQGKRIATLAAEYIAFVDAMRGGQYADEDEYRILSSQRMLVHDELIRLTGITDRSAMYGHCRTLLAQPHSDPRAAAISTSESR